MPHIETKGDRSNMTHWQPLKRSLQSVVSKKQRENAQAERQREAQLPYPDVIIEENRVVEEGPCIKISLIKTPQYHNKQEKQTNPQEYGTQLSQSLPYGWRN